ncbi:hypothetical protein PC116_g34968 [Phytophthora cactorum]|nr:hypothetical protein PC111_g25441 [Phytophthora cactorum]KAG2855477.1 hypothetical protein PC114_g28595 [Phytophthora cactorum]KAG4216551.1 hypothetical protein PC116_g34968 [Phytophthora cactorum]
MERPTTTWSGSSGSNALMESASWRGYPESHNSWEPIERLQADCQKAVAIWEQKRQQLRE